MNGITTHSVELVDRRVQCACLPLPDADRRLFMPAHRQPEGQRRGLCRAAIDYIENGQTNHVIDGPPLIAVRAWSQQPILRGTHTSELKAGDPKVPDFLANQ